MSTYPVEDISLIPFSGTFINPHQPWWLSAFSQVNTANIQVSTLTVNPYPNGGILLQSVTSNAQQYNAPLIFQRPVGDVNAPAESLVMTKSSLVPSKPVDSEFITATKAMGTAYDDIAVAGLQVYGDQMTQGNAGAAGYITQGPFPNTLYLNATGVYMSNAYVSTLNVINVVSSTTSASSNYTATQFMSTPILYANTIFNTGAIRTNTISSASIYNSNTLTTRDLILPNQGGQFQVACSATFSNSINAYGTASFNNLAFFQSTVTLGLQSKLVGNIIAINNISTNNLQAIQASISTLNVSTVNTNNVTTKNLDVSTLQVSTVTIGNVTSKSISSIVGDIAFNLVSTLQLQAKVSVSPNINLGLGDVIQGLIGGATTQALAVTLGSAGLATGAAALINGRTSGGGVDPTVFETVNGSTQLQFSTILTPAVSVLLTTDSTDPLHLPANQIRQTQIVPAGTYCVRSLSDPLNLTGPSSIQMFGQWVPVIQPTATFPQMNISSLNVSSINGQTPGGGGSFVIPSTINLSSITANGNFDNFNIGATLQWDGPAYLSNAYARTLTFLDTLGSVRGQIQGTAVADSGILIQNTNGLTIRSVTNAFTVGANQNVSIFSTLTVSTIINPVASISTLRASNITNLLTSISSLTVSSINGLPPGGGGSNFLPPSTFNLSTINLTGNLSLTNSLALITATTTNSAVVNAQTFNVRNTNNNIGGIISGGNPDLGLSGIYLTTATEFDIAQFPNKSGSVFNIQVNGGNGLITAIGSMILSGNLSMPNGVISTVGINLPSLVNPAQATNINSYQGSLVVTAPYDVLLNCSTVRVSEDLLVGRTLSVPYNYASFLGVTASSINGYQFPQPATATVPPGGIMPWAGITVIPIGWLLCDGSAVSQTTYAGLFAVVGLRFQAFGRPAPPAGTFYLPDLTFAVPMGAPTASYSCSITYYTASANTYSATNALWFVSSTNGGTINVNTFFPGAVGDSGLGVYVVKFVNWSGNSGYVLVANYNGAPNVPFVSSATPVTVASVGVRSNTYNPGYFNMTNVANVTHQQLAEEVGGHTHPYNFGGGTQYSIAGAPIQFGNQPFTSGANSGSGQVGSPAVVANVATPTAPNYINMFYIIKV